MRRPLSIVASVVCIPLIGGLTFAQTLPFDPPARYDTGAVPEPIVLGDLNEDGVLDIAIANSAAHLGPGGDNVTVLLGRGGGSFVHAGEFPVGTRPEGIVLAHLNDDAHLDIATANFGANSVSILFGIGNGTFSPEIRIAVDGSPRSLVALDLNGDGAADLATANHDGNSVTILLGGGDGSYTRGSTIAVGQAPETIVAAQLDLDGIPDLVVCNTLSDSLTPLRGLGDGTFVAEPIHVVGDLPRTIIASDLDGDGLDEIIVANSGDNTVTVEWSLGNYHFITAATISLSVDVFPMRLPVGLCMEDVTGDGKSDLLIAWAKSRTFSIHPRGSGDFDFLEPSAVETGDTPVGIAVADFDEDGDTDVVVTSAGEDAALVYPSFLVADGSIVVDNGAPGTQEVGAWDASLAPFPWQESSLFSKGGSQYVWNVTVPMAGNYEVLVWWTVKAGRSWEVPLDVAHAEGATRVTVDQTGGYGSWHSLGTHLFLEGGSVRVTASSDTESTCADAVRFRRAGEWPPGTVIAGIVDPPADISAGLRRVVAFHGTLDAFNGWESETWRGLVLNAVGPGNESLAIAEIALYMDSNDNGVFDDEDRRVGNPTFFEADGGSATLDGFAEELRDGTSTGFFLVCVKTPESLALGGSAEGPAPVAVAGLLSAGLLVLLMRRSRDLARWTALMLLVLPLAVAPTAGCGGSGSGGDAASGGGGGGNLTPQPLQIEVAGALVEGSRSGIPAIVEGMPLVGWEF